MSRECCVKNYLDFDIDVWLHIFIMLILIKYGMCFDFSECYPAEEEKQQIIYFNWYTNDSSSVFLINSPESFVAQCSIEKIICEKQQNKKAAAELQKHGINNFSLTITIFNITRNSGFGFEGLWTLTTNEKQIEFLSCHQKVYAKPSGVNCTSFVMNNVINLKCTIERIYPKAKCMFFSEDAEINDVIRKHEPTYQHKDLPEKPIYYTTECSINVSLDKIKPGTHSFSAFIYPNVTGNDTDKQFGVLKNQQTFFEDKLVTLRDCPTVIIFGKNFSCMCNESDSNNGSVTIRWRGEDYHTFNFSSNILELNVTNTKLNLSCVGIKSRLKSVVSYNPTVIKEPSSVDCKKVKAQNASVLVSCIAFRVFPKQRCLFMAFDKIGNIKMNKTTNATHNEMTERNISYFNVECVDHISESITQTELLIIVTMFPIVSDEETGIKNGKNGTLMLDVEEFCRDCPDQNNNTLAIVLIPLAIIMAIIIIFLVLLVIYRSKKGFRDRLSQCINPNRGQDINVDNHSDNSNKDNDEHSSMLGNGENIEESNV